MTHEVELVKYYYVVFVRKAIRTAWSINVFQETVRLCPGLDREVWCPRKKGEMLVKHGTLSRGR